MHGLFGDEDMLGNHKLSGCKLNILTGSIDIKYHVGRNERGQWITLMQCDFEDKQYFKLIAQSSQYRIMCDGKDVTKKYSRKVKG